MQIINALIISSLAGLSTLIGTIPILFNIPSKYINKIICVSLYISIIVMIYISIFDLIPASINYINLPYNKLFSFFISLLFLLIGIFVVLLFSIFLNKNNSLFKIGILSMIALMIHNFPEGIISFLSSLSSPTLGLKLTIAIIIHNIPEGLSIAIPIYYSTKSKWLAIKMTLISSLSEPIGALITYLFLSKYITNNIIGYILLVVSGIMISLSICEILPEAFKYSNTNYFHHYKNNIRHTINGREKYEK